MARNGKGGELSALQAGEQLRERARYAPVSGWQLPLIFGIELAARIVGNGPDGAYGLPHHVKRHEEALFGRGSTGWKYV
jgi:hypothetical protein